MRGAAPVLVGLPALAALYELLEMAVALAPQRGPGLPRRRGDSLACWDIAP